MSSARTKRGHRGQQDRHLHPALFGRSLDPLPVQLPAVAGPDDSGPFFLPLAWETWKLSSSLGSSPWLSTLCCKHLGRRSSHRLTPHMPAVARAEAGGLGLSESATQVAGTPLLQPSSLHWQAAGTESRAELEHSHSCMGVLGSVLAL